MDMCDATHPYGRGDHLMCNKDAGHEERDHFDPFDNIIWWIKDGELKMVHR